MAMAGTAASSDPLAMMILMGIIVGGALGESLDMATEGIARTSLYHPSSAMILIGTISGCALGSLNVGLQYYVRRHPTSMLARDMKDGCDRRLYHYVVPVVSMAVGCVFVLVALCGFDGAKVKMQDWWFGNSPVGQWAFTVSVGLGAGHYVQDIVANQWAGVPLFMHHVAAVAHAFCLQATSSWAGALLTWSGVYEAGSLLLCLGYVGWVPRWVGHWAAMLTSIVGMAFGVHGLVVRSPLLELNCCAWFCVVALLLLGLGRIQDAVESLRSLSRKQIQESIEERIASLQDSCADMLDTATALMPDTTDVVSNARQRCAVIVDSASSLMPDAAEVVSQVQEKIVHVQGQVQERIAGRCRATAAAISGAAEGPRGGSA